jgi:L-asparaginase/Glu-tRNA(Gln) amidotransferase subunit D
MIETRPIEVVADPFDLSSLRYDEPYHDVDANKDILLTPTAVTDLMQRLTEIPEDEDKLLVIGIGTGGTIAMSPNGPNGTLVPDLNFDTVLDKSDQRLKDEFRVVGFDAFATDSSQLDIDDVGDLAVSMAYIWRELPANLKARFGGFLVVHGTDTMPISGTHLDMMFGPHMPFSVVHTGAQKSINEKINDAQGNIIQSLHTLKMMHSNGKADGLTVMGGYALLTAGMTKVSDHASKAMWTHLHQPVIEFGELPDPDKHKLPEWIRDKPVVGGGFLPTVYRGPNRVGLIQAEMQEDPMALRAAIKHSGRVAMMNKTYGANTMDVRMLRTIGKLNREGDNPMPLFSISPVNANPNLENYAVSQVMIEEGIQPVHMSEAALRAKIMRIMGETNGNSRLMSFSVDRRNEFIKASVVNNLVGEVPNKESRNRSQNS